MLHDILYNIYPMQDMEEKLYLIKGVSSNAEHLEVH